MAKLGYARVSTRGQDPGPQVERLKAAGCEKVWVETASGYRDDRPELAALLAYARDGDALTIVRLDRVGRSVPHLIGLVTDLDKRSVGLVSLSDSIDTTTASGRLVFTVMAAIAAFEGELRRERQELAWAEGKQKGRPTVVTPEQLALCHRLRREGKSYRQISEALSMPKTTVFRALTPVEEPCLTAT
jgi:DNA invertase Pin-like site-specific DNA recombinase